MKNTDRHIRTPRNRHAYRRACDITMLTVAAIVVLGGCVGAHSNTESCLRDSECNAGQICYEGRCFDPATQPDASAQSSNDASADAETPRPMVFPDIDCSLESERQSCIQCAINNYPDLASAYAYHLLEILYCSDACNTDCQDICGEWEVRAEDGNREVALTTWTAATVNVECNRCVGQIYANDRATTEELDRACAYDMPCAQFVRMLGACPN